MAAISQPDGRPNSAKGTYWNTLSKEMEAIKSHLQIIENTQKK